MGEVDIETLHKIYRECIKICNINNWTENWNVDSGRFETLIRINDNGKLENLPYVPDVATYRKMVLYGWHFFCPDIFGKVNNIAIEFDEAYTKRKKGHNEILDMENRDKYYYSAKIKLLKIYEYEYVDQSWRRKLFDFLEEIFTKQ